MDLRFGIAPLSQQAKGNNRNISADGRDPYQRLTVMSGILQSHIAQGAQDAAPTTHQCDHLFVFSLDTDSTDKCWS